jgi:hypothetical protein
MTRLPLSSASEACAACIGGMHYLCVHGFEEDPACCCAGQTSLREVHLEHTAHENELAKRILGDAAPVDTGKGSAPKALEAKPAPKRGNSGYIHPDAWPSNRDIGTLTDPESTGRKRMVEMYPIAVGQVCEWAGMKNAGGEFMPVGIIGCVNNPATDLHHGPDKNTLNNEKASRGVGDRENIHVICSECHNSTHAANDDFYPPYDRVADQDRPWLPRYPEGWEPTPMVEATVEELFAEEQRRDADRKRRGRKTRGRNSRARGAVDTEIRDELDPGDGVLDEGDDGGEPDA